ncbi:MAG TPA: hypothetical protein VHF69_06565 [Candidatus Synoicihabitans sp.]|nr:hypothetical protein [Candidatus Synoicihabitans sp.]
MPRPPGPLTRRLLAALETHVHDDAGPIATADWAALSNLFDRELALLTRLTAAAQAEGSAENGDVRSRAGELLRRYQHRGETLTRATRELRDELGTVDQARRRTRAVSAAYAAS